jgi:hypothetical protein
MVEPVNGHVARMKAADLPRLCLLVLVMVAGEATYGLYAANDDPPRAWAMYFGGSGWDAAGAIATSASGDSFVIRASSSDAPGSSLLKFNSAGTLLYTVGVGGIAHDVCASPDGSAVVVDRAQPSHVYVGLDSGVARSRDSGETWELLRIGTSKEYVHSVTIDPTAPGDVWAARRFGVFRLAAGDSTFSTVDTRFRFGERISKHSGRLLHSARWMHNGFLTAFDPSGAMRWSTYIGGNGPDVATGVSAEAGSVFVGTTQSELWPLAQAGPRPQAGGGDLFRGAVRDSSRSPDSPQAVRGVCVMLVANASLIEGGGHCG